MTIILFIVSLVFASLIFTKYKVYSLYFLIFHYFFLDLYNYNFGGDDILTFLSKSYREILLVFLLFYFFINIDKFKNQYFSFVILLILSIFLLIVGSYINGFSSAILDWRYAVAPILTALLLSMSKVLNIENLRKISNFLFWLVILNSILIIYQYFVFDGDLYKNWRYEFLNEQNLKINPDYVERMTQYQIVRGEQLRSSGVFLSALHAAYITAFSCVYSFVFVVGRKKFIYLFAFLINILALYYTQVRSGFLIVFLSMIALFILFVYKNYKPKIVINISILFTLFFILILLFKREGLDESILGRIPQYLYLFENFNFIGYGLGSYRGEFDSYYVNGFLTFGFLFALWLGYVFKKYIQIFSLISVDKNNFIIFVYCSIIPALLFSLMQHFIGSLYYSIIWLYLFCFIRYKNELTAAK